MAATGAWSATSNASWLRTSSSSTGNGLATFSFDANAGGTRTGTLTIAGQTLTVTQAGAGCVAANPLTTLVSSGLNMPWGVAVDASGNVYIADYFNNAIKEWKASPQTVSTLVSSGLGEPMGVAVDGSGNVYFTDMKNRAIKEWKVSTQTVSTLVSSGLIQPGGVAVDASGNVYFSDYYMNIIQEWKPSTQTVSTLVPSGLNVPMSVAVDASGNVYFSDRSDNTVKEWNASTQTISTLVSSGLSWPQGVAVDGSGNVYIADANTSPVVNAIKEWNASTQTLSTLVSSGLNSPDGVAVNASGNVYIADSMNNAIKELPRAFVPAGPVSEGAGAGSDTLPVLPSGELLTGAFAPASDQSWLTIGAVSGGAVNFSFTGNSGAARTAHITLMGQQIAVTQASSTPPGNLGVFSGGYWYLDTSGTGQWTSSHSVVAFNEPGATPVVGNWDGSGRTEPGFYLNGTWWLQTASGVETFSFGFSGSNVFPVVGDWNGGGKTEVGVYCNGAWFRDMDGSHTWDATNQAALAYLGWNDGGTNSVVPVPGHWAGDAKTEMGVYCQGVWFLDSTGSGQWDQSHSYWGWAGSLTPVVGNWSNSGTKDQFAVYNEGVWFRDADGTHTWDAANQSALAYYGWSAQPAGGGLLGRHHAAPAAGSGRRASGASVAAQDQAIPSVAGLAVERVAGLADFWNALNSANPNDKKSMSIQALDAALAEYGQR